MKRTFRSRKMSNDELLILNRFYFYLIAVSGTIGTVFEAIYGKRWASELRKRKKRLIPIMNKTLKRNFTKNEWIVIKNWLRERKR